MPALSLFLWECLYVDLPLPNLNLNFLLTFVPYLHLKRKKEIPVMLHTSPILSMFGLFLYFTINLINGSLMLSEVGSQAAYSAVLRSLAILEKKVFGELEKKNFLTRDTQ